MGHTYFQLLSLGAEIAKRKAAERQVQLDIMRTAQHADRGAYDRYRRSLEPLEAPRDRVTSGDVIIPQGFNHTR